MKDESKTGLRLNLKFRLGWDSMLEPNWNNCSRAYHVHQSTPSQKRLRTLRALREALYSNIVVTGGSTLFPNFEERLRRELRALAPTDYAIGVKAAPQPLLSAWRGGSLFAASEGFAAQTVTREQYREGGHSLCRRKFLGDTEGGVTL